MKNLSRLTKGHDGSMERAFYVVAITPRRNRPLVYPPLTGARALKAMRELERRKIKVDAVTLSGIPGDEFEEQLTTAELAEMVEDHPSLQTPFHCIETTPHTAKVGEQLAFL